MELISLKKLPKEIKLAILKELGYTVDEKSFVTDQDGRRIMDKYIEKEVQFDNMLIMPGSAVILDDNELSLSLYLEEFGDVL